MTTAGMKQARLPVFVAKQHEIFAQRLHAARHIAGVTH